MRVEISKLHKKLKTNIIYVTHDQIEAMTLADRIVVLNKGNIEQYGTPNEIYSDPNNIFVAEFIGSPRMNILKIDKGSLSVGSDADLCIVDIYKPWVVKKEKMISKSKNTCIEDKKLQGKVLSTFINGVELFKC